MPVANPLRQLTAAALALCTLGIAHAEDAPELTASRAIALKLIASLGAELKAALAAGGPANAVRVCKDVAPALAGELSRTHGARVTRVSLKVRNPLLGTPDAWEQQVLTAFDERAETAEPVASLEYGAWVDEPQGRSYRYMKAIPVQPLCLSCHGAVESLAPEVASRLQQDYPADRAVGYRLGQLRGAVSVRTPAPR